MGKGKRIRRGRHSLNKQKIFAASSTYIHVCQNCDEAFPSECKIRRWVLGPHWRRCRQKKLETVEEVDLEIISCQPGDGDFGGDSGFEEFDFEEPTPEIENHAESDRLENYLELQEITAEAAREASLCLQAMVEKEDCGATNGKEFLSCIDLPMVSPYFELIRDKSKTAIGIRKGMGQIMGSLLRNSCRS